MRATGIETRSYSVMRFAASFTGPLPALQGLEDSRWKLVVTGNELKLLRPNGTVVLLR